MSNTTAQNVNTEATTNAAEVKFREDTRRQRAYDLFVSTLSTRTEVGNTAFRRSITDRLQEEFNMTIASAAATYNIVKKLAVEQGLCENFGRTPAAPKPAKEPKAKKERKTGKAPVDAAAQAAADAATEGTVRVVRAKDNAVVAEGITIAEAQAMVEQAVKQKKAKLEVEVA